jgi:hypothetical protein
VPAAAVMSTAAATALTSATAAFMSATTTGSRVRSWCA